jgi:hypothetical protein
MSSLDWPGIPIERGQAFNEGGHMFRLKATGGCCRHEDLIQLFRR